MWNFKLFILLLCFCSVAQAKMAVWLRPLATPEQLVAQIERAKQAGFDEILLEGFYH